MERARLARDIIDTCLEMTRMGLNQGTAGNISVRYRDGMLITPTGIPYEHLTEESIVYVDAQGRHEEDKLPSSEWRFHQVVYQTRPDANAVVHNHAVNCTAVSILNRPIYDFRRRGKLHSLRALRDLRDARAVRACRGRVTRSQSDAITAPRSDHLRRKS